MHYLGDGLLSEVREVDLAGDSTGSQFFAKISRSTANNELLEREHRNLLRFSAPGNDPKSEEFVATQRICVPHPYLSAMIETGGGERRINVQCIAPALHFTAQWLREDGFPQGMPLEQVYWIFRRLLLTIWAAHQHAKIVHGGITPEHVLIYPDEVDGNANRGHGVVLIDWTGSALIGKEHVPVLDPLWEEFYPPEIRKKALADPTMDIFMAAAVALYLAGGNVAKRLTPQSMPEVVANDLLRCLSENPRKRPHDAEEFYRHFEATIESVHGKRQYAPLVV